MKWHELRLVAVDSLVERTGAAVRNPMVRDTDGRIFVVRDVDAEEPVPNCLISVEETAQQLEAGAWIGLPEWSAVRGAIIVVQSERFHVASSVAEDPEPGTGGWSRLINGYHVAYLSRADAASWRRERAVTMLEWAEGEIARCLSNERKRRLVQAEEVLQQARYVCNRRSPERRRLYAALGVLLQLHDEKRFPAIAELAVDEFSTLEKYAQSLDELRERLRQPSDADRAPRRFLRKKSKLVRRVRPRVDTFADGPTPVRKPSRIFGEAWETSSEAIHELPQ